MKSGVRAFVSVGIIVCLLVGTFANSAVARKAIPVAVVPSAERVGTLRSNTKATRRFHRDVDLFYVSKRKVPNGPDPIHNRRAETSRRPPGV